MPARESKRANTRVKEKGGKEEEYPNKMRMLHIMLWLWQECNTTVDCLFFPFFCRDKLFNLVPSVSVCLGI